MRRFGSASPGVTPIASRAGHETAIIECGARPISFPYTAFEGSVSAVAVFSKAPTDYILTPAPQSPYTYEPERQHNASRQRFPVQAGRCWSGYYLSKRQSSLA